jgi:molybdenum cofactor cytidylyltransferase
MTTATQGPRVGLVLLAAGLGRRMGGPNKLLIDLEGLPVVRRAALPLVAALAPDAPRVAVTGRDAESVAAALGGLGFRAVHNARFEEGMGTSVAVGVAALPEGLDGILVALGDMPDPAETTIRALVAALGAAPDPAGAIVRPRFEGAGGNPVLWGARYRAALAALDGDRGGRDLIRAHTDHLRAVDVEDPSILRDIDRPADLEAVRAALIGATARKRWS